MEGEINNFIMVWSLVFISVSYCYAVANIASEGKNRFLAFLPVVCLFLILPLNLHTIHLGCPTAFFITWLANFKLLLLAFGKGPLSDPSLSLGRFVAISCLPILVPQNSHLNKERVQKEGSNKGKLVKPMTNGQTVSYPSPNTLKSGLNSPSHYAKKASVLACVLCLTPYKEYFPTNVFSFVICIYVVVGLEVMLGVAAIIGEVLLGIELEPPFNDPYLSASLQDFWGRRWNRVATSILHSATFDPIIRHTSRALGRTWALISALLGTFLVSALMHELIFSYIGRMRPRWGTTLFFLIQGLCLVAECMVKRKFNTKRRLPQLITGPLIFGFVIITFMIFVLPELLHYDIYGRALQEYAALGAFLMNLGLACKEKGYSLLVQNVTHNSISL